MRYSEPMSWLMRSLLIWLLVLAVPAQAAAVAARMGCGPRHQAAAVAGSGSAHGPHAYPHAHLAGQTAHDHQHTAAPAAIGNAVDALASIHPAPETAAAVSSDAHKCSACASCCSAGAILNTVPTVPMPEFAAAVFADWAASVAPFAVDGPDRPPRSTLA